MNRPVSLKALAESKAEGIQKATHFKVDPHTVEFEPGFNLRDEGPELDAYIDQLEAAMRAGAYIPPIDLSVVDGRRIVREGHCRTRAARRIEGYLLEAMRRYAAHGMSVPIKWIVELAELYESRGQ